MPRRARQPHRTVEFQREPVHPIRLRQLQEIASARCSRVVHDDVDPAIRLERGFHESSRSFGSAEIQGHRRCRTSASLDFRDHLGERSHVARGEHEFSTFTRQAQRDGPAYPAAAASHDDRLTCKRSTGSCPWRLPHLAIRHTYCLPCSCDAPIQNLIGTATCSLSHTRGKSFVLLEPQPTERQIGSLPGIILVYIGLV